MTLEDVLLTLRIITALTALVALGGWCLVSTYRWPHFDTPDKLLTLAVAVLLFALTIAFSVKAAAGPPWLPITFVLVSLAGLCAALAYRIRHRGHGHIGHPTAT